MTEPILAARGLSVSLAGRAVLQRIDLTVLPGERVALIPRMIAKGNDVRARVTQLLEMLAG